MKMSELGDKQVATGLRSYFEALRTLGVGLLVRWKRIVRRILERRFGREQVNIWAARVPFRRVTYCLCAYEVSIPPEAERSLKESGFTFREGTVEDVDRLEGEPLYGDCRTYRAWLAEGQTLLLAETEGRIASYLWLDSSRSVTLEELPEFRVEINPLASYTHEAWTLPAYRGRSLRRMAYIAEMLLRRQQGLRWKVGYQLRQESLAEMLRNFERTGIPRGSVIGEVEVVHFAGLRFTWARGFGRSRHPAAHFVRVGR